MTCHFAGGPRRLFSKSKVQRRDASRHALHGFDLSLVVSGCKHLILRVRHESQARLATTRFGVRGPVDVPELGVESAIWDRVGHVDIGIGMCIRVGLSQEYGRTGTCVCLHIEGFMSQPYVAASPPRHFRTLSDPSIN